MRRHPRRVSKGQRDHAGVPVGFTPFRDRSVRTRVVACPDCKAPIGAPCVNGKGEPRGSHGARRRMAIRALNNQTDEK